MYDGLSNKARNKELKKMLANETIVLFPDRGIESKDGMPNLSIVCTNLKNIDEKTQSKKDKIITKGTVDCGLSKKGDDDDKKTGSFDPKNFKNNSDLYRHISEY